MLRFIKNNNERAILYLILLTGALLRIYDIWGLSLTNDEFSAIARAQLSSFSEFISKGIYADIHPAGIEFFLYLWIKVFGTSVFIIRLPFIAAGIFSIYVAYRIAARWFNEHTGLFVAAALCFLEFPLMYSQLASPFIPGLLFSLLTVWFWTKMLFDNRTDTKNIIYLALSISLAAYSHYFTLAFISIVIFTGIFFLNRKNIKAYLFTILFAVIFYIPNIFVIIHQINNPAGISWLTVPDNNWFFKHVYFLFNNSQILLYLSFAIFIVSHIINFTEVRFGKFHIISALWFLLPFLVGFYYSLWIKPILENAILLFSFPFLLFFIFSFIQREKKVFNFSMLGIFLITGLFSTIVEKKYYSTYHFGEFKDIAAKTIEWNDQYGDKNITKVINVNSPFYINYYLEKAGKPLSFAMYKNEGRKDLHTLNKIVKDSKTSYFLYAWSSLVDPNETGDIITVKYPYIIKQIDYNGMAGITLYSMTDSTHAIPQSKPVYYIFNGFEEKNTWEKNTSIITTEKVWKGKYAIKLDARDEYGPACVNRISRMTDKPFKRIQVSLWAYATGIFKDAQIVATLSFRDDDNQIYEKYFWLSSKFEYFIEKEKWGQVFFSFNLPDLRSRNDELKIYVWNPDKQPLYIDNFELKTFE
ncbi:MAG: glycosyltransferase family 39 protein [Bacteroidales bacterium]